MQLHTSEATPRGRQTAGRARAALADFVRGATQPSLAALVGTLLVAAGLTAWCARTITPARVASSPARFARDAKDESVFLTAKALRIAGRPAEGPAGEWSVTVVGDSSISEAISSADDLARFTGAGAGRPVAAHLLTAGGLNLWDEVAVTDYVRPYLRGVVFLEISPHHLSTPPAALATARTSRLGFQSEAVRAEMRLASVIPPRRWGNYFLDNLQFFAARADPFRHPLPDGFEPPAHFYGESQRPWSRQTWRNKTRLLFGWDRRYPRIRRTTLPAYARMIARLRSGGNVQVVLLQDVQNPRLARYMSPGDRIIWQRYRDDLDRLARESGVGLLDLNTSASLVPSDFADYTHVRTPAARQRCTRVLAAYAAKLVR